MESTSYNPINLMMDTTPMSPDAPSFMTGPGEVSLPVLDPLTPISDAPMSMPIHAPLSYLQAPALTKFTEFAPPQYSMMEQAPVDVLACPMPPAPPIVPSMVPAIASPAAYVRSRANTLSSLPSFVPPSMTPTFEAPPKDHVVGSMLKSIAGVINSAGDACHQHQTAHPLTPGDEHKTRQVIAQINDLIHGMGLPTSQEQSRKRQAPESAPSEQPLKKILKPEPEDVPLPPVLPTPAPFLRTQVLSRSQPPSRPHSPPNVKPAASNFRPSLPAAFPAFGHETTSRFGHTFRHRHSQSMGSIPREAHGFHSTPTPAGRMNRTGHYMPEYGWPPNLVSPKSAPPLTTLPTLAKFSYPAPAESVSPTAIAEKIFEEDEEENDGDLDDNDTASPSGSSILPAHSTTGSSDIPAEYRSDVERLFLQYLNRVCSDLEATDSKGDLIHQPLMPKKMQKLDESTDFRPFKFRIQAFTTGFLDELAENGFPEEKIPMKRIRGYLWRQPFILRYNEEGKKAKSKGNHVWNIEAKKLGDGQWDFRPFHRKITGDAQSIAYCGLLWSWQPRISDPHACWKNVPVQYSSPSLPPWLSWKDDVLSGTPPANAESCEVITHAKYTLDGQEGVLSRTFLLTIAPLVSTENSFVPQRPMLTPRTVSDSAVPTWTCATPRTVPLVTDGEDGARVKMVLEHVAQRLTFETQLPGQSSIQDRLAEQTVNACLDDYEHSSEEPQKTHELAVAGQNVVAQAAEYIVRNKPEAVLNTASAVQNNVSAVQNVTTEELVTTTQQAIAEAVKSTHNPYNVDELSILLLACRMLDPSPPVVEYYHQYDLAMPTPGPEWYSRAAAAYV